MTRVSDMEGDVGGMLQSSDGKEGKAEACDRSSGVPQRIHDRPVGGNSPTDRRSQTTPTRNVRSGGLDNRVPSPGRRRFFGDIQMLLDTVANSCRRCLYRVPGKMSIAGGGLHLRVTKQLPDHRQALAERQGPRGKVGAVDCVRSVPNRLVSIWNGRQVPADAPCDPRRGVLD